MMPLLISVAGLSSCPLAPEKERSRSQISTSAFVLLHDYYYYCFLSFFFSPLWLGSGCLFLRLTERLLHNYIIWEEP